MMFLLVIATATAAAAVVVVQQRINRIQQDLLEPSGRRRRVGTIQTTTITTNNNIVRHNVIGMSGGLLWIHISMMIAIGGNEIHRKYLNFTVACSSCWYRFGQNTLHFSTLQKEGNQVKRKDFDLLVVTRS